MGPIWDFDAAYGAAYDKSPEGWRIRKKYWNYYLFKNEEFSQVVRSYWFEHRKDYIAVADSIVSYGRQLDKAAQNNFERWPILDEKVLLDQSVEQYGNYEQAVLSLQKWLYLRIKWIDEQYEY